MWQSQWLRRPCAQPELPNLVAKRKTAPKLFWGTEDSSDPDIPGARKTAATRISLGHGSRQPGYPWGTEDGSPDIPGSRRTSTKLDGGTGGVPSCTTIVPAVSGAEPPELDVPRMKKGRVSFFRRMRNRSEQSKAGCSYGNFGRLAK